MSNMRSDHALIVALLAFVLFKLSESHPEAGGWLLVTLAAIAAQAIILVREWRS